MREIAKSGHAKVPVYYKLCSSYPVAEKSITVEV
jgi:hypothetical protein